MKIVTYLLAALLIAALGAAGLFYYSTFQPMLADYTRMKAGMPELDKASAELKKYKEKEKTETAWINPAVEALKAGLSDEIKAGTAEVAVAGAAIVVNFAELALYTPGSVTFAKDSPQLRLKLATLLGSKDLKGKEIVIGNTTDSVPAQGKGRKKIPPRDARTLAADRSVAMTKYLEQNKVDQETLIAAAYAAKLPDRGFRIKDHKTIIIIKNPSAATSTQAPVQPKPAPAPAAKPAEKAETPPAAGTPQAQPKTIPLRPVQPKGQ